MTPPRDGEGNRAAQRRGGGGSPSLRRPTVYAARKLRREMTLPERMLWKRLRGSSQGVAFRKQHPIDPYVADFYCAAAKLVIEVDGEIHNRGEQPERDVRRNEDLHAWGYRLLRIPAADILRNADEVAASIVALAANPLHHRPSAGGPPPRERGGAAE